MLYSYIGILVRRPAEYRGATPINLERGRVPAYGILDLNSSFRILHNLEARLSLNNLANKQYFHQRPVMYPGPGIWPSEGRNYSLTFCFVYNYAHEEIILD